jgi:hypothetical protein
MNSPPVQPLGDRSTNAKLHAASENYNDGLKQGAAVQSMEYHRNVLQEKLKDSDQYVFFLSSPSHIKSHC